MNNTKLTVPVETKAKPEHRKEYTRFTIFQRIEHFVLLLSFSLLGFTGLPQKFINSPISIAIINALGGIEGTRVVHRVSATVLMVVSVYHLLEVIYKVFVQRTEWTMLPLIEDFNHVIQDVLYYIGFRKHPAHYGRYNYGEKMEYLAVVWGTVVMAITGFMMWNPIATARYLPGEAIPAAKAAHGGEAVLAVAAIILWHFYNVHLRHFNKSMFTGKMTREEMRHEHPAELAEIESGQKPVLTNPKELKKRQRIFYPFAAVVAIVSAFGIYGFVTFEQTAITTLPNRETVAVFVPITPTPRPTPTLTPTPVPGLEAAADTWDGKYGELFRLRCSTCHGVTAVGGLSLADYQKALEGGNSGPAIVPGDPDRSKLVEVQSAGNHPGQLTPEELEDVINWIKSGAPEK
jgi:cytochrome b subunit of formate dehydrogenase